MFSGGLLFKMLFHSTAISSVAQAGSVLFCSLVIFLSAMYSTC